MQQKQEAVALCLSEVLSCTAVAQRIGIPVSSLAKWVRQARIDRGDFGPPDQEQLLGSLVKGQQQGTLEVRLAQYSMPKLLIVDNLGYLALEPQAGHVFFQLISRRCEQGSVLISFNRPAEEWDKVFGDQVVADEILDRLLHHSHGVTIRGDSYRLREKRRSGLFRPQTGSSSPPLPVKEA